MPAPALTPAQLDQAAVRLWQRPVEPAVDERAWADIVEHYERTAPASPAARPLLTKTVDELVDEALGNCRPEHGVRPAIDVRLPGRLSAALPEWLLRRYARRLDHPPSVQLHVAEVILREWGWQQQPHHLRNRRGARCVCGAICTAVSLGVGSEYAAHRAAWHVLCVLRGRGWPHLIGDWNQQAGRTAEQAIEVVAAARQLALATGQ